MSRLITPNEEAWNGAQTQRHNNNYCISFGLLTTQDFNSICRLSEYNFQDIFHNQTSPTLCIIQNPKLWMKNKYDLTRGESTSYY